MKSWLASFGAVCLACDAVLAVYGVWMLRHPEINADTCAHVSLRCKDEEVW